MTHSPSRTAFSLPWLPVDMPRTTRSPRAQDEDIGEMLGVPFSFMVVINATGVPT